LPKPANWCKVRGLSPYQWDRADVPKERGRLAANAGLACFFAEVSKEVGKRRRLARLRWRRQLVSNDR
jgi:hypothetical protein